VRVTVRVMTVVIVTAVATPSVVVTETFTDFFWVFTVAVTFVSRFAGAFAFAFFRSWPFTLGGLSASPESAASAALAFVAINVEVDHGEPATTNGGRDQVSCNEIIVVDEGGSLKDSLLNQCCIRRIIGEVEQGFSAAAAICDNGDRQRLGSLVTSLGSDKLHSCSDVFGTNIHDCEVPMFLL